MRHYLHDHPPDSPPLGSGEPLTVADYLEAEGLSEDELAAKVGVAAHSVRSRRARPFPKAWAERLGLELELESAPGVDEGRREHEQPPQAPPNARVVDPPLEGLDYSTIAGHIEGAYLLGAHAARDSDPALAGAIESHAAAAGHAWARWIESEPKVAALLQRMMVGTPLGEVIAVHVGIGFGYFIARGAEQRARADLRRESGPDEPEPEDDATARDGAPDYVDLSRL